MTKERKRCAIYTRKSSEEGLDQAFNSLDAQREACAAYVASQAGEGWELIRAPYDDGGFSGGSMERPALQRLLDDIDRGRIDVIVVYKVDRLTRSLADFARIVERLESRSASFVSITQAFNTTTSMGRLTLNVLLSFAQFEREVTGERIRDKIAASKAKGLWMGGRPMLGYAPTGRTLTIDPEEAKTVRLIFERYLDLGSVHTLQRDLADTGIRGKRWTTQTGKVAGGGALARGALYQLLRNRIYVGEIVHKGVNHPGQHAAIIDADLFVRVQAQLESNAHVRRTRPVQPGGAPLTGLLEDEAGHRMSPTQTRGQSKMMHRYYVSRPLIVGGGQNKADKTALRRVPARALEDLVADRLTRALALKPFDWESARRRIKRVIVGADTIRINVLVDPSLAPQRWLEHLPPGDRLEEHEDSVDIIVPATLSRQRGANHLLDPLGRRILDGAGPDPAMVSALAKAWRWRTLLMEGAYPNSVALARAEGITQTNLHRSLRLAYLAPDLIEAVLDGRQRPGLTLIQLCDADLPLDWAAQRRLFGAQTGA